MEKKRFKKMQALSHLIEYLDSGKSIDFSQLRPILFFLKMVSLWIE